jgi:hypothetical protein
VQQRDPLAAMVGRPTAYLAAISMTLYASFMTWINRDDISDPWLAVLAIVLVVVAAVVLCVSSSPLRAPLVSRTLVVVVSVTLLAHLASALSMWSSDSYIRDDWGPPAIGIFIVALAPYRPAKELATAGVLAAIFVAVVALVQSSAFVTPVPPGVFVVVAVTPVLALSIAAAAFVDVLVRSLERWRARSKRAFSLMSDESGAAIARSVQQDSVTILNQEVVPFFTDLLDGETVTEDTRRRAVEISDAVRALMVADVDRTWLDVVVEHASIVSGTSPAVSTLVRDDRRLAEYMSADERTALRALIVAIHSHCASEPFTATVDISDGGARYEVVVHIGSGNPHGSLRADLAPYLAVLRVVFSDLQVEHESADLTLRFSYEQR